MPVRSPRRPRVTWNDLSDETQLDLAAEALRHAVIRAATQAEGLAEAMRDGTLPDRGGADALRLLCALLRAAPRAGVSAMHQPWPERCHPAGHA